MNALQETAYLIRHIEHSKIWHFSSFKCKIKSQSIAIFAATLFWWNFFRTFRQVETSIFTLSNLIKRKYGVSKLGFTSYGYGKINLILLVKPLFLHD